jgi:hypothetical protein
MRLMYSWTRTRYYCIRCNFLFFYNGSHHENNNYNDSVEAEIDKNVARQEWDKDIIQTRDLECQTVWKIDLKNQATQTSDIYSKITALRDLPPTRDAYDLSQNIYSSMKSFSDPPKTDATRATKFLKNLKGDQILLPKAPQGKITNNLDGVARPSISSGRSIRERGKKTVKSYMDLTGV